jgi:hypothetical protein
LAHGRTQGEYDKKQETRTHHSAFAASIAMIVSGARERQLHPTSRQHFVHYDGPGHTCSTFRNPGLANEACFKLQHLD